MNNNANFINTRYLGASVLVASFSWLYFGEIVAAQIFLILIGLFLLFFEFKPVYKAWSRSDLLNLLLVLPLLIMLWLIKGVIEINSIVLLETLFKNIIFVISLSVSAIVVAYKMTKKDALVLEMTHNKSLKDRDALKRAP